MEAITILDNEELLRKTSEEVKPNEDITEYIKKLEEYCTENEVMAMAAIQLEIPKRIIYLKNTNLDIINKMQYDKETDEEREYNESRILINPVIKTREGLTEYWEACASCLDNLGLVKRPYKITLEYYDVNRKKHEEDFIGFESTVLSHEYDHLNGILHMDIAEEVHQMNKEERKVFRQTHGYKIFSKTGNYDDLIELTKKQSKTL